MKRRKFLAIGLSAAAGGALGKFTDGRWGKAHESNTSTVILLPTA